MLTLTAAIIASTLITPTDPPLAPPPCTVTSSTVHGVNATFTVSPADCVTPTAPISFSAYNMPGGFVLPFAEQVAVDHATAAGVQYGPGDHLLTLAGPLPCNWQTDLYWSPDGLNQPSAPHSHPINGMNVGWDYSEGNECELPPVDPPVEPPVEPPVSDDVTVPPELAKTGMNAEALLPFALGALGLALLGIGFSVIGLVSRRREAVTPRYRRTSDAFEAVEFLPAVDSAPFPNLLRK